MRTVYVNGEYLPEDAAKISIFDRGFLFGDGVYEVSSVLDGRLIDNAAHLIRLQRSLDALSLPRPASDEEIVAIQNELIDRNQLSEGVVYLQVTRGAADRDFNWPEEPRPSLVLFTQQKAIRQNPAAAEGIAVATVPDLRWKRRDIKTVNLLPASWAKEQARAAGAQDAWMVEDGHVTEGSSNNTFIVTSDGTLVTRQLSTDILHGITRHAVMKLAAEIQLRIEERPFTPEEAKAAREAFATSASSFVMPVVEIDGQTIGDGTPGPIAQRLRTLYIETALEAA
ncbi:MAG: D-amino-acid transaminase [Pseudomonadota bacterium]